MIVGSVAQQKLDVVAASLVLRSFRLRAYAHRDDADHGWCAAQDVLGRRPGDYERAQQHLVAALQGGERAGNARGGPVNHRAALEQGAAARQDQRWRIGEIETLDRHLVDLADQNGGGVNQTQGTAGFRIAFQNNSPGAAMKYQRLAGESSEHIDDDREPLRRLRAFGHGQSPDLHRWFSALPSTPLHTRDEHGREGLNEPAAARTAEEGSTSFVGSGSRPFA